VFIRNEVEILSANAWERRGTLTPQTETA
jgi:hypothetical protein